MYKPGTTYGIGVIANINKNPNLQYYNQNEYYRLYDPIHILKYIKVPILYINAEDDMVFGKELISQYQNIINTSETTMLVQTKYGGHLGFYNLFFNNWAFKISKEFIQSYKKNKYYSELLELQKL